MERTKDIELTQDSVIDDSEYQVILFNDDFTPFEYVIIVLMQIFEYSPEEAINITMRIHTSGQGVVATTSMEEAYKKVDAVEVMNNEFGQLLQSDVRKV